MHMITKLIKDFKEKRDIINMFPSKLLTTLKPLTVWVATNCGKFLKRWKYQTTLPASWDICIQVKKQQLEPNMEQWTGSNWERSMSSLIIVILLIYLHEDYIMGNAGLDDTQARIKTAGRNINNLRYADDNNLMAESKEKLKSLWLKVKEETEKGWFKT